VPLNFVAKLAITAALTAAQMALTASQRIKGPRLDVPDVMTAENGTPIPRFWGKCAFPPPVVWAETIRVETHTSKTKGGKLEQQRAFGTWANLITDMEIDAVSRIWFDEHLVFDVTGMGPISIGALFGGSGGGKDGGGDSGDFKLSQGRNFRLYLGTDDQPIDPRYEAWCEDRYGAGSATAFRGSALMFFEDIPLEKFGNRLPQVRVEAIRNKQPAYLYEQLPGSNGGIDALSPDQSMLYQVTGDAQILVWDLASRALLVQRALPIPVSDRIAVYQDPTGTYANRVFGIGGGLTSPWQILVTGLDGSGGSTTTVTGLGAYRGLAMKGGVLFAYPANTNEEYQGVVGSAALLSTTIAQFACGFSPTHYCTDFDDGTAWSVGTQIGDHNLGVARAPSTDGTIITSTGGGAVVMDNGVGQLLIMQAGALSLFDKDTLTIVDSTAASAAFTEAFLAFDNVQPGASFIWIGPNKYDTRSLELLDSINPNDWVNEGVFEFSTPVYSSILDGLASTTGGTDNLTIRYLNRVDTSGWTFGALIQEVTGWIGAESVTTTSQTQIIYEYMITQGQAKDIIAPLLEIFDVDARQHDFGIEFVNRGGSPVATIATADMVKEDREQPRYKVAIQQDADLPIRTTLTFADRDHDHQKNTVISQLPFESSPARKEETIDMTTFGATPSEAQQYNDRRFRRVWNSRETHELGVSAQLLKLEAADLVTLDLDGLTRTARIRKLTISGTSKIALETVRDEVAINSLSSGAGSTLDGKDDEAIIIPGPTRGFIVDAPLISDADNDVNPVIYYGAGGYGISFPGATVWRGDDGTFDEQFGTVSSADKATWGMAVGTLATANPNLWDRGNSVSVNVYGTLASATEAAIDADPSLNFAALGVDGRWEYLQFATATLTGTSGAANSYTLSGFKRGRRGTEGNVGNHAAGDDFVLLADLTDKEIGTDEIGNDMSFKAQTIGRPVEAASTISLVYDGNTLKPYSPARVIATFDGTDWTFKVVRRSRIGANWPTTGWTVPLGEASEAYEVEVYNGSTLKRTLTLTATDTVTYTNAMQLADFGSTQTAKPPLVAYQISATVGRGFALAA
jgi:hypothetical protein